MSRKHIAGALIVTGLALLLSPPATVAQVAAELGYFGTCIAGSDCSIETRLDGADLCTDGVDNDGNGYCDATGCGAMAADPHCQAEVLCQDGFDNDDDGAADGNDIDCRCIRVAASLPGGNACTANDITVSYTAQPVVSDGCINSTDSVVAQLFADITVKPERYDLGMWIALDGNDGLDGTVCTRQMLQPVAVAPTSPDPTNPLGIGPFNDLDGDRCGDRQANLNAIYKFPFRVNVPCTDLILSPNGQAGFVDLGQCGSWAQPGGNPVCSDPGGVVPGTSSKCNCSRGDTGVPGPNFRLSCTNFAAGNVGPTLEPGETADFLIDYSNTVANCTPGSPTGDDPLGRFRCGTVSFIQIVVHYSGSFSGSPVDLNSLGEFLYDDGSGVFEIPACTTPGILGSDQGAVCNDASAGRLIFSPRDAANAYSVVSAFSGSRTLPFQYHLSSGSSAPEISLESEIYWSDSLDGGDGTITATEAVTLLPSAIPQTCSDCACSTAVQATPITLGSFRATPAGRAVRFDWSTETEVGNVGFNLYALVDGDKIQLNREPIPVAGLDSLEPQSYSAELDVPPGADGFLIEDLDLRGRGRFHGPFAEGEKYGSKVETEPLAWGDVRRTHGLNRSENGRAIGRAKSLRSGPTAAAFKGGGGDKGGGSTPSVPIEIQVDQDGIHRVSYEQLAAAGFDLSSAASGQLALVLGSQQVPIHVVAGIRFGPGSYFEFWGETLDTLYTRTNVYRLLTGQKRPARATVSTAAASGAAAATYVETRQFERDRGYAFWSPADDPFFDTEMLVFSSPGSWPFAFTIDGYVPAGGGATLRASVYGGTSIEAIAPDHHVELLLNGVWLGEASFDGTDGVELEVPIPAGALANGANTLVVRLPGDTGAIYDLVSLDSFSIDYPRAFVAEGDGLEFSAAGGRFDVAGLPDSSVVAYRQDSAGLTRLAGTSVAPAGDGFTAIVPGNGGAATFAVVGESALLAPAAIQAARPAADLLAGPASLLVVSHAAFLDGLSPLVAARTAQGYSVKVVDVEDVYSAYRHGVFDAGAIRDYIADAYATMGTRFVLLVGGDTYDYHDHLGLAPVSFLPSLYRETGDLVRWAPSDASYADVDGDGVQDLAIGRLPVRTPAELEAVVAKTLAYDARSYLGVGVFAADYTDAGANESFVSASDRLIEKFQPGWQVDRVYLDKTPLADARGRLFADLAQGASLTHYVGHSGLTSWGSALLPASQHLFTIDDVASLANAGRPSIFAQLGCWNTYYTSPRTESLGARLLLIPERGAAAVLGAATLTVDANGNRFGALLAPLLATPGTTIGEAVRDAKAAFAASAKPGADSRDVLYGWLVLGDPTLPVSP
jgi:hypothetical protein